MRKNQKVIEMFVSKYSYHLLYFEFAVHFGLDAVVLNIYQSKRNVLYLILILFFNATTTNSNPKLLEKLKLEAFVIFSQGSGHMLQVQVKIETMFFTI